MNILIVRKPEGTNSIIKPQNPTPKTPKPKTPKPQIQIQNPKPKTQNPQTPKPQALTGLPKKAAGASELESKALDQSKAPDLSIQTPRT